MSLPTPYYDRDGITIYCADNRDILPKSTEKFDLLLTDPPYGIKRDEGLPNTGHSFGGKKRVTRKYAGGWDGERPNPETIFQAINICNFSIIWGGNYISDMVPVGQKWLVWDKQMTMPTFSDVELAWSNIEGSSLKMFRYSGNGLQAKEKNRIHPTQKPIALISWCLSFAPNAKTVFDPYMGSGTTLVAAKLKGLRAVGIEREEEYCKLAIERLRQGVLIPY